jgi:hypothetical protein
LRATGHISAIAFWLLALAITACHEKDEPTGALYSCDAFVVYPDSIVSDSLSLAYRDGHGMAVTTERAITFHQLIIDDSEHVCLSGSDTLFVDLFNDYRPASIGECTLDELALLALPADANILLTRLEQEPTVHNYLMWPITSTDFSPLLARNELLNATGRGSLSALRREASREFERDRLYCRDRSTGLYRGITRREIRAHAFPVWMDISDMATVNSLRANIEHVRCIDFLASQASQAEQQALAHSRDSLVDAIDTYMWVPDKNSYCSMLYGSPASLQSPMTDNNTQALAAIYHVSSTPMAEALVANAPMFTDRVASFYPASSRAHATTDRGVATALMCVAAARCGNQDAFSHTLGQLAYMVASRQASPTLLRGALLRGLAGIEFTPQGLMFTPFVPEAMDGTKTFANIPYRDAQIDLTITGWGDVVSSFAVDDKLIEGDRTLSPNLKGRHSVSITLVGSAGRRNGANTVNPATLVATPTPTWTTPSTAQFHDPASSMTIFVDSEQIATDNQSEYQLQYPMASLINFVPTTDGVLNGFSTATHICAPKDSTVVDVSKIGRTGARSIKDKKLAKTLVESTRYKNAKLTFKFTAPKAGRYYVKVTYLNGQGIVNPDRRLAMRMLAVNGVNQGIIIFPQLNPLRWTPDVDWQQMRGATLPIAVDLNEGLNTLSLNYFSPPQTEFNHDNNSLIPDKIILQPVK